MQRGIRDSIKWEDKKRPNGSLITALNGINSCSKRPFFNYIKNGHQPYSLRRERFKEDWQKCANARQKETKSRRHNNNMKIEVDAWGKKSFFRHQWYKPKKEEC